MKTCCQNAKQVTCLQFSVTFFWQSRNELVAAATAATCFLKAKVGHLLASSFLRKLSELYKINCMAVTHLLNGINPKFAWTKMTRKLNFLH